MQVAQRGTSSTTSGMHSVDRWSCNWSGGGVTQAQVSESSGTVFENGFHNYFRLTNTSNTTTDTDYRFIYQTIEAQNVVNSGWNFKSTSSYITFSFWVRSSLAGTYYTFLDSRDGTGRRYSFSYTLSADTWTKVTKTIPGASNIALNNDNGEGIMIQIIPWYGTYYTTSGHSLTTWHTGSSTDRTPDYSQNWANTSNATFDVTGVQLEVGSVATDFEHRSYGQELALCQRYYYRTGDDGTTTNILSCAVESSSLAAGGQPFPTTMRALPTITIGSAVRFYSPATGTITFTVNANRCSTTHMALYLNISSGTEGQAASIYKADTSNGYVEASAEL